MEDRSESEFPQESLHETRHIRRRRGRRVCGYRKLKRHPRPPIQQAETLTIHWLKRVERRVCGKLARELKELGLITSEWEALREMYKPDRTSPLALARALRMSKGGASKLIDRLVKKKLVRKKVAAFDRRCRVVGLTMKGEQLVPYLSLMEFSTDYEAFRRLGGKMHRKLLEALRAVILGRLKLPTMQIPLPTEIPPPQAPVRESAPAKDVDPARVLLDWSAGFC
jgi:DNA-binding MarR family transcriptional regulator